MRIKVFWQAACPNCPLAKDLGAKLEEQGKDVKYYDIKEPDGLTEGVMHDVMSTPSIIIVDDSDNEIASYRSDVPKMDEILKVLS